MTDERKYKTFNSAEGRGISLTAALNWGPGVYRPESAIYLRYGNPGSGTYASLSRDETEKLIDHLKELVAAVDAAKPREKTVPEKVAELPVGTIFTTGGFKYRYVKLGNGEIRGLDLMTSEKFTPDEWKHAKGIDILYTPTPND